MKKFIFLLFFFISVVLISCSIKTHYILNNQEKFKKTNPEDVKIFSGQPDMQFVVIGCVAVDAPGDGNDAVKSLKEEAASIGANAVMEVRLTKLSSFASRTGLSGTAICITQ